MSIQPVNEPAEVPSDSKNAPVDNSGDYAKRYITRLRFKFLTPIVLTLSFAVMVIISIVYYREHQTIDSDVIQLQSTASSLFHNSTTQNAKALQSIMDVLKTDKELATALAKQDRQRLLRRSAP
ncbi:hypothetical protein ACFL2V_20765, partial [Pseudomonadota bacterium]